MEKIATERTEHSGIHRSQIVGVSISDVMLEAEASPPGSLEAPKVLPRPRLDVLIPRLGLAWVSML